MFAHDVVAGRQTESQTDSLLLAGKGGIKNPLQALRLDPHPVVGDFDDDVRVIQVRT